MLNKMEKLHDAVSCGYDTCFAVKACDGLYHLTKSMDRIETPLHSEIDQIHLSTEAQCGTTCLPLGDTDIAFLSGMNRVNILHQVLSDFVRNLQGNHN